MSTANDLARGLVIGVTNCPACGGELVRDNVKVSIANKISDNPSPSATQVYHFHKCRCSWAVTFLPSHWSGRRSIDTLIVRLPGVQLPECMRGHSLSWSIQRRVGNRLDCRCVFFDLSRLFQCGDIRSVQLSRPPGFLSKPGKYDATKSVVLRCLDKYREEGLTLKELRSHTRLTDGQLVGYLKRGTSARVPLVEKVDRVFQPPNRVVNRYRITAYGLQWVQWANERNYFGET
jgi:hypothetical protein